LTKIEPHDRTDDERLSELPVININKNIGHKLNIETIIDEFAKFKRRISFTSESN